MADKERQHYVPQFLLRNFSSSNGKNVTNLYNKKYEKTAYSVSIRTQAQEKFFYGLDTTIEDFFAHTESKIAPVITKIIENEYINTEDTREYAGLLHFISFFAFRTKSASDQFENALNTALKELSKHIDGLKEFDFENNRVSHPEPGAYQVAANFHSWMYAYDLDPFLLVNTTETDFIISDNPLVVFNPMMQARGEFGHSEGLINKGLLLLFPIAPNYCIMLIDSWAYDVYWNGRFCTLDKIDDVHQINLLQAISGNQNIFFANSSQSGYVQQICADAGKHKIDEQIVEVVDHPEKPGVKILYTYHLMHKVNCRLSFIRESDDAKKCFVTKFGKYPRSQDLVDMINKNQEEFQ